MARLELKVPPDLVALVVAGMMWLAAKVTSPVAVPGIYRGLLALALLAAGAFLIASARVSFARAATTFSPLAPDRAARLVTTGVYRFTRNPMYLGTLLALLALAVVLSSPVAALVAMAYVPYIDRFQIAPEERVLRARFGGTYDEYAGRVRRWI